MLIKLALRTFEATNLQPSWMAVRRSVRSPEASLWFSTWSWKTWRVRVIRLVLVWSDIIVAVQCWGWLVGWLWSEGEKERKERKKDRKRKKRRENNESEKE